jgi:hypothetical protein
MRPPTLLPHEKAFATGRWAEIIFRALSSRVAKRWHFVSFRGTEGGEWRGVVDVLAVRKDTAAPSRLPSLKPGDLFELLLIQVKGGSASLPSVDDRRRLAQVKDYYHARDVVLFEWRKGERARFSLLGHDLEWTPSTGTAIFP